MCHTKGKVLSCCNIGNWKHSVNLTFSGGLNRIEYNMQHYFLNNKKSYDNQLTHYVLDKGWTQGKDIHTCNIVIPAYLTTSNNHFHSLEKHFEKNWTTSVYIILLRQIHGRTIVMTLFNVCLHYFISLHTGCFVCKMWCVIFDVCMCVCVHVWMYYSTT